MPIGLCYFTSTVHQFDSCNTLLLCLCVDNTAQTRHYPKFQAAIDPMSDKISRNVASTTLQHMYYGHRNKFVPSISVSSHLCLTTNIMYCLETCPKGLINTTAKDVSHVNTTWCLFHSKIVIAIYNILRKNLLPSTCTSKQHKEHCMGGNSSQLGILHVD